MNALRSMFRHAAWLSVLSWLVAGCGSPLVGLECRAGFEECNDGCYQLASDHEHCGSCNTACTQSEQCLAGVCTPGIECREGLRACGGSCFDLSNDDQHCGACGTMCGASEQCVDAVCKSDVPGRDGGDAGDGGLDATVDGGMDAGEGDAARDAASPMDADSAATEAGAGEAGSMADGGDGSLGRSDGGDAGASGDAGGDAGDGDGATNDDAGGDAGTVVVPPPLCTGVGSPADCVCDLGQRKCGLNCVNTLTDHEHCGACDAPCLPEEYCNAGTCAPLCTLPVTLCNGLCVDLQQDDTNCGSCGNVCGTGAACIEGDCVGRAVGHIVVVGHDLSVVTRPIRQIVANAVFLAPRTPVRVLVYDAETSVASRAGVNLAIQQGSTAIGRAYSLSTANSQLVTEQLGDTDVFVIEVQQGATDQELADLGASWSAALHTFLFRGGVILLFDGVSGANAGTYQILKSATAGTAPDPIVPLFDATARTEITQRILSLVTPSDAVASGVSTEYQSQGETVGFTINTMAPNAGAVVVRDTLPPSATNLPVVIHAVSTQ